MLATCCTYVCGILALLTALFFSPLAFHTPTVVAIDDIKEWGLKGPHRSSLPKNMQGVYYLNGNQVPWNDAGRCNATEAKDKPPLSFATWQKGGNHVSMLHDEALMRKVRAPLSRPQPCPHLAASRISRPISRDLASSRLDLA